MTKPSPSSSSSSSSSSAKKKAATHRKESEQGNDKRVVKPWTCFVPPPLGGDASTVALPKFSQQRPTTLAKWKFFLLMGIFFFGLSVAAILAHVRSVQRSNNRGSNNNNNNDDAAMDNEVRYFDDDTSTFYTSQHDSSVNVFDPQQQQQQDESSASLCGPVAWPHLVDVNVNDARHVILQENECVFVQILFLSALTTEDSYYDPERVRLYVNQDSGLVARIPRVG